MKKDQRFVGYINFTEDVEEEIDLADRTGIPWNYLHR